MALFVISFLSHRLPASNGYPRPLITRRFFVSNPFVNLFGLSPSLSGSVGKGGANSAPDVILVKALLNAYQRHNSLPAGNAFPLDAALFGQIEIFLKREEKLECPTGQIERNGTIFKMLLHRLWSCYGTESPGRPDKGWLTWEAEGHEGGRDYLHSRRLHVPSASSGLTIGRGYDISQQTRSDAMKDLVSSGVPADTAFTISGAGPRTGIRASQYVVDHDLLDFEISTRTQLKLFEKTYQFIWVDVVRISDLPGTIHKYGKVNWKKLDQRIQDVLVDLRYRGDYTDHSRTFLQKHIVNNDLKKFAKEIANKGNWKYVPEDRFYRRKEYALAGSCREVAPFVKTLFHQR
ncbi:MAG: hypothetical protein HY308_09140 [Gammaproteobacteria bacterium]|nr:hypothetical protein [Gammaproteobacteria bacterium]